MKDILVNRVMRLVAPLSTETKLEILSKLSDDLKRSFHSKEDDKKLLLDELFGAWSESDDDLSEDILNARTISSRDINFD